MTLANWQKFCFGMLDLAKRQGWKQYIVTKNDAPTVHIREGGFGMKQITSYGFDIDTACAELRFSDGSTIAIDTIAVENEFAETWLDRRELDYLIYNDPLGYADLVLNGDVRKYLDTVRQGQTSDQ